MSKMPVQGRAKFLIKVSNYLAFLTFNFNEKSHWLWESSDMVINDRL